MFYGLVTVNTVVIVGFHVKREKKPRSYGRGKYMSKPRMEVDRGLGTCPGESWLPGEGGLIIIVVVIVGPIGVLEHKDEDR